MKDTADQFAVAGAALAADPVLALAYIAKRRENYDQLTRIMASLTYSYLEHTIDADTGVVTHTATGRPCLNMACFKAFILARYW